MLQTRARTGVRVLKHNSHTRVDVPLDSKEMTAQQRPSHAAQIRVKIVAHVLPMAPTLLAHAQQALKAKPALHLHHLRTAIQIHVKMAASVQPMVPVLTAHAPLVLKGMIVQ